MCRRSRQHCSPILLNKALQDQAVVLATGDRPGQLIAHPAGDGASHVIAFQQHLVAPARTHHLVAQIIETRLRIAGPGRDQAHRDDHRGQ